jgi:8-oxo-dGTP pyrophosphatase MutT (NUDIX family)
MAVPVRVRRAAIRCAYAGLRLYWFIARPNVVGVKCVVTHDDHVLLVRHTYGRRSWDLPGGTVRRRELPIDAARREMSEELGRRIDDWQELGVLYARMDHHRDSLHMFQAEIEDRQLDIDLTELAQAAWFRRDELPPDISRFVGKILARAAMANEA